MIIECPSCGARAKIPESKEGAKVRCVECERIYVAKDATAPSRGGGRGKTQSSSAVPIGIGAAVVALVMILVMMRGDNEAGTPEVEEPVVEVQKAKAQDDIGWDSPVVKRLRKLHDLGFDGDEFGLQSAISWPHAWARVQRTAEDEPLNLAGYEGLTTAEKDVFRSELLGSMTAAEAANLVGGWKPFDGSVVTIDDDTAVAQLALEPRTDEIGTGTRNIEWRLVKSGNKWLVWSWERWMSERELKSDRVARTKNYEKKTLSDGSKVIEGEPGPIAYMDETTMEMRAEIDGLIAQLLDLELPAKQLTQVKAEIVLHGKHAIPPLLTKFYEINQPGTLDDDSAMRAQLLHTMLGDITGYVTTFAAHEALGATKERRDSGVRQWFGWYNRKFKRFETASPNAEPEPDALEAELLEGLSEAEKREYEKQKRIIEQQERAKAKKSGS